MSIKKLKLLGNGFTVIPLGEGTNKFLVQSVPGELTMDHTTLLQEAEVIYVTLYIIYALQRFLSENIMAILFSINCPHF